MKKIKQKTLSIILAVIMIFSNITIAGGNFINAAGEKTELYIDKGDIVISGSGVSGYGSDGSAINTPNNNGYIIKQTDPGVPVVDYNITITGSHSIELDNLNIVIPVNTYKPAIDVQTGAVVDFTVTGDNTVAGGYECAAIQGSGIARMSFDGAGNLHVTGGYNAPGIGARAQSDSSSGFDEISIKIDGGNIKADLNDLTEYSPGIGIASSAATESYCMITINGGTIEATGSEYAAGIGGGSYSLASNTIAINGGNIEATGGLNGAGIGGGFSGTAKVIINGGNIKATSGANVPKAIGPGIDGADFVPLNANNVEVVPVDLINNDISVPTAVDLFKYCLNDGVKEGYGDSDIMTDADGKFTAWLPVGKITGTVLYKSKSYDLNIDTSKDRTATLLPITYISIENGTLTINDKGYNQGGVNYDFKGTYLIRQNGSSGVNNQIIINKTSKCDITLKAVYLDTASPIVLGENADVNLTFAESNQINNTDKSKPAIELKNNAKLTINGDNSTTIFAGEGQSIGSASELDASSITINSGVLNLNTCTYGPMIGCRRKADDAALNNKIMINGGRVSYSGSDSHNYPMIGGFDNSSFGEIIINGGSFTATAKQQNLLIGGGANSKKGKITINGGNFSNGSFTNQITAGNGGGGISVSAKNIVGDNAYYSEITLPADADKKNVDQIMIDNAISYSTADMRVSTNKIGVFLPEGKHVISMKVNGIIYSGDVNVSADVYNKFILTAAVMLDLSVSDIEITSTGYTYNGATIGYTDVYMICQSGETTTNTVNITSGQHQIIISGNINVNRASEYEKSPVTITGKDTQAILSGGGNITLRAPEGYAGISVAQGAALGIDSENLEFNIYGGDNAAGIGGGSDKASGNIVITDGIINARGGANGSGIGGGSGASNGGITVKGGTVTATGGVNGSGIGGGNNNQANGGAILIEGGTVTPGGGIDGSGIGGGKNGVCGKVSITGGSVNPKAGEASTAGVEPNDIGGGAGKTAVVPDDGGSKKVYKTKIILNDYAQSEAVSSLSFNCGDDGAGDTVYKAAGMHTDSEHAVYAYLYGEKIIINIDNAPYYAEIKDDNTAVAKKLSEDSLDLAYGSVRVINTTEITYNKTKFANDNFKSGKVFRIIQSNPETATANTLWCGVQDFDFDFNSDININSIETPFEFESSSIGTNSLMFNGNTSITAGSMTPAVKANNGVLLYFGCAENKKLTVRSADVAIGNSSNTELISLLFNKGEYDVKSSGSTAIGGNKFKITFANAKVAAQSAGSHAAIGYCSSNSTYSDNRIDITQQSNITATAEAASAIGGSNTSVTISNGNISAQNTSAEYYVIGGNAKNGDTKSVNIYGGNIKAVCLDSSLTDNNRSNTVDTPKNFDGIDVYRVKLTDYKNREGADLILRKAIGYDTGGMKAYPGGEFYLYFPSTVNAATFVDDEDNSLDYVEKDDAITTSNNREFRMNQQAITFSGFKNNMKYGDTAAVTASGGSLPFTFSASGGAKLENGVLTITKGESSYFVTALSNGDARYWPIETSATSVSTKAPLTVEVQDQEVEYATAKADVENQISYKITGFITGEDESKLTGTQTLTTGYESYHNVGVEDVISASSKYTSDNYYLTYIPGRVTIKKRKINNFAINLSGYVVRRDGTAVKNNYYTAIQSTDIPIYAGVVYSTGALVTPSTDKVGSYTNGTFKNVVLSGAAVNNYELTTTEINNIAYNVIEKQATGISFIKEPNITYQYSDCFDFSDTEIRIVYDSGSVENVKYSQFEAYGVVIRYKDDKSAVDIAKPLELIDNGRGIEIACGSAVKNIGGIIVTKADPVLPEIEAMDYNPGKTLADVTLPSGWTWNSPATKLTVNQNKYKASYIDTTGNYLDAANVDIGIEVRAIMPKIPIIASMDYVPNKKLSTVTLPSGWSWDNGETILDPNVSRYAASYTDASGNYQQPKAYAIAIMINKTAPPTPTISGEYVYDPGRILADIILPSGWSWAESNIVPSGSITKYKANYIDSDNIYLPQTNVDITINMKKAEPTVPVISGDIQYHKDMTLADITLPAGWSWSAASSAVIVGSNSANALYRTDDPNYNTKTETINFIAVQMSAQIPVIEAIDYSPGSKLSGITLPANWTWDAPNTALCVNVSKYKASYTDPSERYAPQSHVDIEIIVNKIEPVLPQIAPMNYDPARKLSDITLPASWTWDTPNTVPSADVSKYKASYTDPDGNYNSKTSIDISVRINKINPVMPQAQTLVYSPERTLASLELPDGWSWDNAGEKVIVNKNKYKASYANASGNYNEFNNYEIDITVAKYVYNSEDLGEFTCASADYNTELRDIEINYTTTAEGEVTWENPEEKVTVQSAGYKMVFIPADTDNYDFTNIPGYSPADKKVHMTIKIDVSQIIPNIINKPKARTIPIGWKLEESALTGGEADVSGEFTWENPGIEAVVSGEYNVIFTPEDTNNYASLKFSVPVKVRTKYTPGQIPYYLLHGQKQYITLYMPYKDDIIFFDNFDDIEILYTERTAEFNDIKDHWAEQDIKFVVENFIYNGISEHEFAPDVEMTRAMFVKVMANIRNVDLSDEAYSKQSFKDVDYDAYYARPVEWAKSIGVINGISETEFAPDMPITRQEMATIIYRFANMTGLEIKQKGETIHFDDKDEFAPWAAEAIEVMSAAGIIKGRPDNKYKPLDTALRGEASAVIHRLIVNALSK